ncbi:MAG: hypothetical protein ACE5JP_06500 [Candidatus Bipolaricaulia bacterium]
MRMQRTHYRLAFGLLLVTLVLVSIGPQPTIAQERYNWFLASDETYWYSLFNFANLVIRAGMGERLMPPPEMVQGMMQAAGVDKLPVQNPYLVMAPYASGDPHFIQQPDLSDAATLRWDPNKMDKTVTPEAIGYTIIKEVEWIKHFENFFESGTFKGPPDSPNQNRFIAMLLGNIAAATARFAQENLRAENGLFAAAWRDDQIADANIVGKDQVAMLWGLSSLASVTEGFDFYVAPLKREQALAMVDNTFKGIIAADMLQGMDNYYKGRVLQALAWYASTTEDESLRRRAVAELHAVALDLASAIGPNGKVAGKPEDHSQLAVQASTVTGLLYAHALTDFALYQDAAFEAWDYVQSLWDEQAETFASDEGANTYRYTAEEIGDIVGAFNTVIRVAGREELKSQFATFFRSAVKRSGLQLSELLQSGGGQDGDGVPPPPMAGGQFGQAPVFATAVAYNRGTGQWSVVDGQFTTAQAMYLADQAIWTGEWKGHAFQGPPAHGIPTTTASIQEISNEQIVRGLLLGLQRSQATQLNALNDTLQEGLNKLQQSLNTLQQQQGRISVQVDDLDSTTSTNFTIALVAVILAGVLLLALVFVLARR